MKKSESIHISDPCELEDSSALLEQDLIREFLCSKGVAGNLRGLPKEKLDKIMSEASQYASGRLAELEAKKRLKEELERPSHF
jgi:hypothetical protein